LLRALALAILVILVLGGCKSPGELRSQDRAGSQLKEFIRKHEATFDPVKYDPDPRLLVNAGNSSGLAIRAIALTALPETTSGFRVQVLLTQVIDQASELRDTLDALLPNDWVYVVYDAPYYKVRIGDFRDRSGATQMVKRLSSFGFKDAWIVPDNILMNIPSKPPDVEIEAVPRLEILRQN